MKEHEKATALLIVEQLRSMSDSQFLGYIAMVTGADSENPMTAYMAKRLDMIAVTLAADEVRRSDD